MYITQPHHIKGRHRLDRMNPKFGITSMNPKFGITSMNPIESQYISSASSHFLLIMAIRTALTERLGIRIPVVQGGMQWYSYYL